MSANECFSRRTVQSSETLNEGYRVTKSNMHRSQADHVRYLNMTAGIYALNF